MKAKVRTFSGTTSNEVTQREIDNRALARKAAAEGFVLLKNEDHFLPAKKGGKIALYGAGAAKTIKGGTGSGDVNERDYVTIAQGMKNAGYEVTTESWLDSYMKIYNQAREDWKEEILKKAETLDSALPFWDAYSATPFFMPCGDGIDVEAAKGDGADTAVFVIARIAGENKDRFDKEGDYFISAEEKALLAQVCESYKDVVLVINTGGLMDLAFADEFTNIRAIVQYVQAGQEGGNAFADVFTGEVTPSGKMTDTWALDYMDYPNAAYFSHKSGDVYREEYKEGIYVGYRYFDTFDIPVRYSFGYGLSYTDFAIKVTGISKQTSAQGRLILSVSVDVTNIGTKYFGKEVAQVYVSCPQGKLPKEFRRLAAFGKTKILAPGETQSLTLTMDLYQLASYSEEQAAWLLEAGTYGIWAGSALSAAALCGTFELDEDKVLVQCEHICPLKENLEELQPDKEKLEEKQKAWVQEASEKQLPQLQISAKDLRTETVAYEELQDHYPGRAGEIVDQLSIDELIALATGDPAKDQGASALGSAGQTVPGAAAETVNVAEKDSYNVASIVLADGPAGLRLRSIYQVREDGSIDGGDFLDGFENGYFAEPKEPTGTVYHQYCTAIPVGTLLAQSWNLELMKKLGQMIAGEMNEFEVTLWLAPGMSLHRNPLCGRNFEYYSEDPLIAGKTGAAMVRGIQSQHIAASVKHFAVNNKETNRKHSDSRVSERALREIYLKAFELIVKEAQPWTIMSSYNAINGHRASECRELLEDILRGEWGFEGMVTTDWWTRGEHYKEIKAGNDVKMGNGYPERVKKAMELGELGRPELEHCARRVLELILKID